jgi:hypothetical protein
MSISKELISSPKQYHIISILGALLKTQNSFRTGLEFFLGFLFGAAIISILLGSLIIFLPFLPSEHRWYDATLIPSTLHGITILILSLGGYYILLSYIPERTFSHVFFVRGISSSFILLLFSSWPSLSFGFIPDIFFAKSSLPILLLFLLGSSWISPKGITYASFAGALILLLLFTFTTEGRPIFTDDHGSVLYRLQLLKDYFPNVPVYNTEWNAGTDWRDFFATGILNVFFIFYPMISLFSLEKIYFLIVTLVLFGIAPLATYFGSRVLNFSTNASIIASCITITANAAWYKWSLSYGSMGFVCSTALFPLVLALGARTLSDGENTSRKILISLIIFGTLSIFWSAQGLSLIPIILLALCKGRTFLFSKKTLLTGMILLLINLPWIILFITVSKVGSFVGLETTSTQSHQITSHVPQDTRLSASVVKGKKQSVSINNILKSFRNNFLKINPLLLLLGIPSLLFFPWGRGLKTPYALTCLWLLFLGIVVVHLKPQLELDRMIVILSLVLSIPVGNLISKILEEHSEQKHPPLLSPGIACIATMLMLGFFSTAGILQNRSWEKYKTWNDSLKTLGTAIKTHANDGRALFSGFILHEFEGGHIAPLSRIADTPIMASSPVHNLWWYTDVIPEEYRKKGPSGIEEYLDLYNVSLVIAHERVWKNYFRNSSFRYEEVEIIGSFVLFKRTGSPNSYFLEGKGNILSQKGNGIDLILESESAILRFNYYPFLEAPSCKKISSHTVSDTVHFINVESCKTHVPITIKSTSPLRRVFH